MNICVCIKQTPDSNSVYIDPISGQVDYERFVQILNPADACAVEAAVRLIEQFGGTILALTLGPEDANSVLRAALAIGANRVLRLWNAQAADWGAFRVASALAACIRDEMLDLDLVLCGDSASDWSSATVGPALAEELGLPQITGVMQLQVLADTAGATISQQNVVAGLAPARSPNASTMYQPSDFKDHANVLAPAKSPNASTTHQSGTMRLQVTRRLERGYREVLQAELPVLLTVTSDLNEPRYPSLPAHLAALKAKIPVIDPLTLMGAIRQEVSDETTLLEMHVPRPRPRRIAAPDSHHSAFERIGEIVSGGATGRKTRLVEGPPEELARVLVEFLRERGFV